METKAGKKVFNGVAIGKIHFYKKTENVIVRTKIEDEEAELARYMEAKEKAEQQLGALYDKAVAEKRMRKSSMYRP